MESEFEPDVLDQASNLESAERDACIAAARNQPMMQATGFCRETGCQEELPMGQLFCGPVCRDLYEKQQRMMRITGKK